MSGRVKANKYDRPVKPPDHVTVCRECGRVLTARRTITRRLCRSCWRIGRSRRVT